MPDTSDQPLIAQVGRAVRQARLQAGLTQATLAERIGSNPTYVTNIEAGRVNLTLGKLAEIVEVLGVRPAIALMGSIPKAPAPPSAQPSRSARGAARRAELLEQVTEYILENGVIGFSLRGAAEYAGTSHRVLSYHFGSAPELVRLALARVRGRRAERGVDPAPEGTSTLMNAWHTMIEDEPPARALLEGLAMAVASPDEYDGVALDAIEQYLPFFELALKDEIDPQERSHIATLGLAVMRGMMLDALATHDMDRLEGAMEAWDRTSQAMGWLREDDSAGH